MKSNPLDRGVLMTKRVTLRTLPERAIFHSQVDADTVILVNDIRGCIKTGFLNWVETGD